MAARRLCLAAPAKINLYLKITGRRPDGYHELNTLMQKLALYDQVVLELVEQAGIHIDCSGADLPLDEGNIVYRAARLFLDLVGRPEQGIRIGLTKKIPIAAGLGGGSSDAATVLRGLDRLLATGCPRDELAAMGLKLGADVPFFIYDMAAAWATGIGEKLVTAVPIAGYHLVLVNPGIAVSTKWAYETFALTSAENIFNLGSSKKEHGAIESETVLCKRSFRPEELVNDLETVTAARFSIIGKIKQQLLAAGAEGAMMSGSGSTVFGLFAPGGYRQAEQCCCELKKEFDQVYLVEPLA